MAAPPVSRRSPEAARARLAEARLYLCTGLRGSLAELAAFTEAVCAAGVDVIQLREKGLPAEEEIAAVAKVIIEAATNASTSK